MEDRTKIKELALCLSGGGYRAALFHLGTLWRLHELGILKKVDRISSVSGGSIVSAWLGLNWDNLFYGQNQGKDNFEKLIIDPIRDLCNSTIDITSIVSGLLCPKLITKRITGKYKKKLYKNKTLQDLPDHPRFVFNATNMQSTVLWRFQKPYMRDYRVGEVKDPNIKLAKVVAASAGFPPFLSPVILKLNPSDFTPNTGLDLQKIPYTKKAVLTDGGVYDNLGLQSVKNFKSILVSDGGSKIKPKESPCSLWPLQLFRSLMMIDNQVRSLRSSELIDSFEKDEKKGSFWGIKTNIADYKLSDSLPCPHEKTLLLADVSTRLAKVKKNLQEKIINWGYAVCDAGVRKYFDKSLPAPSNFPYPDSGI